MAILAVLALAAASVAGWSREQARVVSFDGGDQPPSWWLANRAGWQLAAASPPPPPSQIAAAPTTLAVTVALELPKSEVTAMLADLHALSDPDSPGFPGGGERWNISQLTTRIAAPAAAVQQVQEWLVSQGGDIQAVSPNGGFITARFEREHAEHCFGVDLRYYVHPRSGARTICATSAEYFVPAPVSPLISFVSGLTRLPSPHLFGGFDSELHTAADTVPPTTPSLLRELYALPSQQPPKTNNIQAIAAFNNESFTPKDLAQFQQTMNLTVQPVAWTQGPAALPKGGTAEGSLDVQYIMGVSPQVPTHVWATAGQRYNPGDGQYDNEPFLKWVVNVSSYTTGPIPNIFSISYQDYEDTLVPAFMARLNVEFAQLAMRGTTLVTGSGDWGVGCTVKPRDYTVSVAAASAMAHGAAAAGEAVAGVFRADFPSSSPYVVSVGATTFSPNQQPPLVGQEVGVTFSSGGFSDFFARPSYQDKAVEGFLQHHTSVPHKFFNASGRGFPDVSAMGTGFEVVINGAISRVGGTSASSPTFAAILSRINSARLAAGKRTLGWANPLLYHAATLTASLTSKDSSEAVASFHDVVHGNNAYGDCQGFDATVGWDPMTGLGTPFYPALVAAMS